MIQKGKVLERYIKETEEKEFDSVIALTLLINLMEQVKFFRIDLAKLTNGKVRFDNKDINDIIKQIITLKNNPIKK